MNEDERKKLIKQVEREILFAHLHGKLPPNFDKTLAILKSMNIDPDELLDNAFYKFDLLSTLCKGGDVEPLLQRDFDFTKFNIFDIATQNKSNNIQTNHLISFTVNGDSMVGLGIKDGDVVIAEEDDFESGSIYVVRFDDTYFIKQVKKSENGYLLISANPKYESVEIRENLGLEIIGKVKYIVKKI